MVSIKIDNLDLETKEWLENVDPITVFTAIKIGKWVIQTVLSSNLDNSQQQNDIELARYKEEVFQESLRNFEEIKHKTRLEVLEKEMEIRKANMELDSYRSLINEKDTKLREMDGALKNIVNEFCEGELKKLRQLVMEKEGEIKALKTTNAVKGIIGETLIMNVLKETFTANEVVHTGKHAHECDIHMIDKEESLMIFESKYKSTITKQDIDKFYIDVANMDQSSVLIGAVFISINTSNIPGKGSLSVERWDDRIPLIFIGFHDSEEFETYFGHIIRVFYKLCKLAFQSCKPNDQQEEDPILFTRSFHDIAECLQVLARNRTRMNDLTSSIQKITSDLEANNREIIGKLYGILERHGHTPQLNQSSTKAQKTLHSCNKCNKEVFTNKKDLVKHQRTCLG